MYGLIAALIGVSLATTGLILFFNNRILNNRLIHRELFAATLLVSGGGILLTAYILTEQPKDTTLAFDPNRTLEENPPAAGSVPVSANTPLLDYNKIVFFVWGTPSDSDRATEEQVSEYLSQVVDTAASVVQQYAPQASVKGQLMTATDFRALRESPMALTDWCERFDAELLVAIAIDTIKMPNGDYALWREPLYEALDCHSAQTERLVTRVSEKRADQFPYQLALREDLTTLFNRMVRSQ